MNIASIKKDPAPILPTRQNALSHVRRGRISAPLRVLCYGAEGVGKSTFAAGAPKPLWLGAEGGTGHLDVDRLPEPKAWADVLSSLSDTEEFDVLRATDKGVANHISMLTYEWNIDFVLFCQGGNGDIRIRQIDPPFRF